MVKINTLYITILKSILTWTGISPKYEYCSPPHGGFSRGPPNPYHVSFAPVSMQDSEHHSLSSGAHTEESLSHTDGTWLAVRWTRGDIMIDGVLIHCWRFFGAALRLALSPFTDVGYSEIRIIFEYNEYGLPTIFLRNLKTDLTKSPVKVSSHPYKLELKSDKQTKEARHSTTATRRSTRLLHFADAQAVAKKKDGANANKWVREPARQYVGNVKIHASLLKETSPHNSTFIVYARLFTASTRPNCVWFFPPRSLASCLVYASSITYSKLGEKTAVLIPTVCVSNHPLVEKGDDIPPIWFDDMRTRMHMASLRHTPRIPTNYPIFEPSTTNLTATTTATLTVNPSASGVFSSHKHKRGSSSSRRAATTSGAIAAAMNKTVAATVRDQNLAELDPTGFAKLLNERLQRVVENRAAMERLERIMSEVGNEDEQGGTGVERAEGGESQEVPETDPEKNSTTTATTTTTTQKVTEVLKVDTETTAELAKVMDSLSVASTPSTSTTAITTTANFKPSVLQRPWADRLLAAARVQHAQQGDNAQAILEDHCSRIWDTSADRTPTSSSGSGGDGTHLQKIRSDALGGKPTTSLITQDRDPVPGRRGPSLETQTQEEEEIEDDAIQPPLLQESSSPLSTSNTTNSSSRFDFHQQVAETQLAAELRNQNRCTSSPVASSSSSSGGLVVGYYLCDDPVPYRSQWPSNVITLGQFKHLVPKKGLFRKAFSDTHLVHRGIIME
ncbi:hypothetical protein ACTXT7_001114 [Hymenolepis weldensis]